jgi:hypothetical protein
MCDARLQYEFDDGDRALSAQRADLAMSGRRLFVCLEEMPDDLIARFDPCGHYLLSRGHATARLDELIFTILYPICIASKNNGRGRERMANSPITLFSRRSRGHRQQYRIEAEIEIFLEL